MTKEEVNEAADARTTPQDADGSENEEMPMIEQAEDCLAQSLLAFLLADLRLLSATGRICTKFETFVLASDEFAKLSASKLTGAPDDLEKLSSTCTNEGISPAQIMAAVMVETRKEMQESRKRTAEAETSMFSTILDPKGRRQVEDGMHALFRANYEMIGRDLKADIPSFSQRDFPDFDRRIDKVDRMISEDMAEPVDQAMGKVRSFVRRASKTKLFRLPESKQALENENVSAEEEQSGLEREQSSSRRSGLVRSAGKRRTRSSVAGRGFESNAMEDVGDAFFNMGKMGVSVRGGEGGSLRDSSRTVSEDELLNMMQSAIESRDYDQLDFMASFFKDKSVSQLVILSQARVVWMNDWYPLKDCTYAISVDSAKKEVLVVFRGAITRADWGHATDAKLKEVPNPIEESFEGKLDKISLHKGFYRYLFRERKDTKTTKYEEIASVLHHFGSKLGDYKVVVTGHSLGGALTIVFSLWASADERFTKNGPIKMYTFGNPFVAGKSFVHTFRHQERMKKLQLARFYNERDGVTSMPISWVGEYQHLGVSIKMPYRRPFFLYLLQKEHKVYYAKETSFFGFYFRSLRENYFFNMPLPWNIRKAHSLAELQKRLIRVRKKIQQYDEKHGTNEIMFTMGQLYERYAFGGN